MRRAEGRGRIARYQRRFRVDAPLHAVRAFHERADAVRLLTPAPVSFPRPPPAVREGARVAFTLWLGPLPVRWVARYADVREDGFADVMEEGPFASWRHEHRFRALSETTTEVLDVVQATPRTLASRAIWAGMSAAFAYRVWRTRLALTGRG